MKLRNWEETTVAPANKERGKSTKIVELLGFKMWYQISASNELLPRKFKKFMQVTIGNLTQHDCDYEEVNHILDGSKMKHNFHLRLFVKHLSEKPNDTPQYFIQRPVVLSLRI